MGKNITRLITLLIVGFLFVTNLQAVNVMSVKSGAWNDGSTWNTGSIPVANDNVTIAKGHVVTYLTNENADFEINDLIVDGTLEASSSKGQLRATVWGSIKCDGVIGLGQTGNKYGLLFTFKGKEAAITGKGSIDIRVINLNIRDTEMNISIPSLNISRGGMSISARDSKIIVASNTNITIDTEGYISPAANGGQSKNLTHIEIYGTVSTGVVYLCNDAQPGMGKSSITVKKGGELKVEKEFTLVRTASSVQGTMGGSGVILTVEKGAKLRWADAVTDPLLFTNTQNTPYDPNLEVKYLKGSEINGVKMTTNTGK